MIHVCENSMCSQNNMHLVFSGSKRINHVVQIFYSLVYFCLICFQEKYIKIPICNDRFSYCITIILPIISLYSLRLLVIFVHDDYVFLEYCGIEAFPE